MVANVNTMSKRNVGEEPIKSKTANAICMRLKEDVEQFDGLQGLKKK